MPHWRTLIEHEFLGSFDLGGKDWTLEIKAVSQKKIFNPADNKTKGKLVITFKGADKGLISGATNNKTIEEMYGADFRAWVGKRITIYPTTFKSRRTGEPEACIRVRPKIPDGAAATLPDGLADPAAVEASRAAHDASAAADREASK